jgi:outer membrane protein TolC
MNSRLLILGTALTLSACKVGPNFQFPGITGGTKWKEGQATPSSRLPDAWWRQFGDGELNRLVERALSANNDLSAAKSRVDTARALVGADRARLFPTLGLTSAAGITRSSDDVASRNAPAGASIDLENQNYRSSFNLAYDLDLWGRNKRLVEASSAQAVQAEALLDSQRLGVATEVARQYFLLRGLDAQEAVVNDTIASRGEALNLQKTKTDAGLTDGLATSRAQTELELAKNDLASVQRQRGA